MRPVLLCLATIALLAAVRGAAQDAYVATFAFTADRRLPDHAVSELAIVSRDQTPLATLAISPHEAVLTDHGASPARRLLNSGLALGPGQHQIRLWLSPTQTALDVNGVRLALGSGLAITGRPAVTGKPAPGLRVTDNPRLQKIAPIAFRDDFAREDASADDSQWETQSGTFMVNMSRNPGSSQSAFQLWAAAPQSQAIALAKSSLWFWQNLRFGVSVLPEDDTAEWGLVFNWLDQGNHHLLAVVQNHRSAVARLVRVRDGQSQTLAETALDLRRKAWTRADILAVNGTMQAYLGGQLVLTAQDANATAGRIGLYLNQTRQAFFDDVSVASAVPEDLRQPLAEPFGPCEQQWSDFSGKHFLTDPHMSQWAHPRSFWSEDSQGLFWFRNRLFQQVALVWKPEKSRRLPSASIILFAEEGRPETGYCFTITGTDAALAKNNRPVAQATIPEQISELSAGVDDAGGVVLAINGAPCLSWQDDAPLRRGWLAADLGRTSGTSRRQLRASDWRDHALVKSSHRLDYSFEHAPAAWTPQAGSWQGTHRWACVPKWSFFAGRGQAGPAEIRHGNAILWNLRQVKGDFDLELFMAPLEGTPQRAHFSFPVTLNVAFGADGRNLDSGYNLVFGAYDVPSRLFFQNQQLAENGDRVLPGLRLREGPWYHRMTQTWQHLRIQRRDGRVLAHAATHDDGAAYQGLQPLFDVPANGRDDAGQFAVWTWGDNGLAIARATLSFQDSPGPAAPPPQPPARTPQTAATPAEPRHYIRYQNPIPGGQFATVMQHLPVDIAATPQLTMLWRPGPDTRLSLLATVRDQCAEWILTGPAAARDYTIAMPPPGSRPHPDFPGWHTVTINLHALREFFPDRHPLTIQQIAIGSPYDSLEEIAGFGVNPLGAWMDVAFFKLEAMPTAPVTPPAAPDWRLTVHDRPCQDDFEASYGEWHRLGGPDGAALLLDRTAPAAGGASLRLLNQRIGGTAGAWISKTPFRLDAFPALSFLARIPAGVETNLIVIANQRTFEIGLTGADTAWPKIGQADAFRQDGSWQQVDIPLAAWLQPRLSGQPVVVEALALADSRRMSSYQRQAFWIDDFQLVPAVTPATAMTLHSADAANPVTAFQVVADPAPTAPATPAEERPGATLTGQDLPAGAEWVRLTPRFQNGLPGRSRRLRIIRADAVDATIPASAPAPGTTAPGAPYISYIPSDRLCRNTFEVGPDDLETCADYGDFSIRREAWVLRNENHGATGAASAELVNLDRNGFCSIYLHRRAWDPQRWPCVSFDYMFRQSGGNLNLTLLVNDAMTVVEWTGPNGVNNHFYAGIVGRTPYARQDRQWHHTSFNLLEMLQQTRYAQTALPVGLQASELATWATRHHGGGYENPDDARVFFDNFTIYSEKGRDPAFEWKVPGTPPVAGYAVLFDQSPDTIPPEQVNCQEPRMAYHDIAPGQWFFHVRAVSHDGTWGPAATRAITIRE